MPMGCRRDEPPDDPPRPAAPLPAALEWVDAAIDGLRRRDLLRPRRVRRGRQGREVDLDGRRLVHFGANDYLGYAGDVRLTRAASRAACAEGFGAGASPLVSGRSASHAALERAVARLLDADDAMLFPSGYAANAATIAALVGPGDLVCSDARNHASIVDGCRLSRATVAVFPHRDLATLERMLSAAAPGRRLVVSDSLFSMDGTVAPLPELCAVAARHGAMLMIDEAHATGVFGTHGSGLVEASGCTDGVHVRVGTLSKALGASGGFVAGHRDLIRWLEHAARGWIFSTAHPPAVAGAALAAIDLIAAEPHRRRELLARAQDVRERLAGKGVAVGGDATQIVPVVIGPAAAAVALSARLAEGGVFVPAIRPPSVPEGESLVRAGLSWAHTPDDLDRLVNALVEHVPRVRAART
ncbi:MAG: aminotransferase class I/II-fold pyridoxal phosphate-dependent enzyme [Planctomycetaceae bacterium]